MAPRTDSEEFKSFAMKRKSRWDVRPEDIEKEKKTKEMEIFLLILAASNSVLAGLSDMNPFSDEYIDYINSKPNSWTAGRNFPADTDYKLFRLGLHEDALAERLPERKPLTPIPLDTHFDARVAWPDCETINEIRDQSNCEGCWAFAPVEVISDRICIHSDNNKVVRISPQELIECCTDCAPGGGCNTGSFYKAWYYWRKYGLVTGGDYNDTETCLPFKCPPCTDSKKKHCGVSCNVPTCKRKCQSNYGVHFEDDKHYGAAVYSVPADQEEIMQEIMINGPVQVGIITYYDFPSYKSGVYSHKDNRTFGHHAMKIIGWGEEKGIPYWTVANSKGIEFGERGFMKILRGHNECEIESHVHAGIPELKNRKRKK